LWDSHGRQALARLLRRQPPVKAVAPLVTPKTESKILETQP